jgi:low temperature requirement protein LtrA
MYFAVPWVEPVVRHRQRGFMFGPFVFGYGHLVIFAALAAIGAGLHVAAISLEHEAEIGAPATVLSVAIPIAIYVGVFYALYSLLMRQRDRFHIGLLAGTAAVLVLSVVLAAVGVSVAVCLVVMVLAPATTVVGYEIIGHRHITEALERL